MEKIKRDYRMIVVSDTTPLISLIKVGHLELVHELFGEIQIPDAVYKELISNNRFPNERRQIQECSFIKRVSVEDVKAVTLLRRSTGLDAGESEAIILADTIGANLLIMDEVKGRQVAKQMGIQLMGTIGMLITAYEVQKLNKDEILNCVDILRNSGRHISSKLYEQLLQKLEE